MRGFVMLCLIRPRKRWILMPRLELHVTIKPKNLDISWSMAAVNIVVGLFHPIVS